MTKAALVTGISGGIGAALGAGFREAGWRVIGADIAAPPSGACDAFVAADLDALAEDDAALAGFAAGVRAALGGASLAALINNAAVQVLGAAAEIAPEDWRRTLNVNLTAPLRLIQTFLPELEGARGAVVNIGSVHARATKPGFAAYATSKAALHGLTRALAVDLGPRVRVACLAPGAVATPMLVEGFAGRDDALGALEAHHPAGRIASAEEVARAALFLADDRTGFFTGSTLWLDGGVLSRLHDPA